LRDVGEDAQKQDNAPKGATSPKLGFPPDLSSSLTNLYFV